MRGLLIRILCVYRLAECWLAVFRLRGLGNVRLRWHGLEILRNGFCGLILRLLRRRAVLIITHKASLSDVGGNGTIIRKERKKTNGCRMRGKLPMAVKAHIFLHGSFAKTYKGHGTDKALVAGILGMKTDDERIRFSLDTAKEEGLEIQIETGELEDAHPNTAEITLTAEDGEKVSLRGSSIGGGNILITRVNGMEVSLTGQNPALIVLHKDAPGTIAAVTEIMAEYGANICSFHLAREAKGGLAVMTIESDSCLGPDLNEKINQLENIYSSTLLERV